MAFIHELPFHFEKLGVLGFLSNPFVLIILGVIFLVLLRLKRNAPAAFLWGFVGYYHLFRLLPQETGDSIGDMKTFFLMMGSTDFLVFIVGNLALVGGAAYIYFVRGH